MWIWILGSLSVILSVFLLIQTIRIKALIDLLKVELENRKQIQDIIESSSEIFNSELKEAFNNDDEVGAFFSEIEEIQEKLNLFVNYIDNGKESE